MKTHKVESKYKNPDKLIKGLQKKLDDNWNERILLHNRLNGCHDKTKRELKDARKAMGVDLVTMVESADLSYSIGTRNFSKFAVEDDIIITGKVKKIVVERKTSDIVIDKIHFRKIVE